MIMETNVRVVIFIFSACHGLGEYYQKVNRRTDALKAYSLNCFSNEFGPSCLEYVRLLHNRGGMHNIMVISFCFFICLF